MTNREILGRLERDWSLAVLEKRTDEADRIADEMHELRKCMIQDARCEAATGLKSHQLERWLSAMG